MFLSSFLPSMPLNNKRPRDAMGVILSEAKDLAIGMRVYRNQLKINEAKIIRIIFFGKY